MKLLSLDNDYEFEYALTRKNAASGNFEPASGLAGLSCRISLTDGGAAVNGALNVAAAERSSDPGVYYGVFQGDDLRTYLGGQIGLAVYEVFGDGTNIFTSIARRVTAPRRP